MKKLSPMSAFLLLSACVSVSMSVTFGTYVLFLQSIGLSPLEINLVNFAFYVSRFVLEMVTGAIADVFGRKASFVISCGFYAAGLVLYWSATSIGGCILAECVLAVGSTCASGAFEAWAVDELHAADQHEEVAGMLSRQGFLSQVAVCVGAPIGGLAASVYGPGFAWLIAATGFVVVGLLALVIMRETRSTERTVSAHRALWTTLCMSWNYVTSSGSIRRYLMLGALFMFGVQIPNMQWAQLFGKQVGGLSGAGILFTFIGVAIAMGAVMVPRLTKRMGGDEVRTLRMMLVIAGVSLVMTVGFGFPLSVASFLVYEFANGSIKVLKSSAMNRAIVSKDRATVLSCESMTSQVGGAAGLVLSGMLVQYVAPSAAWILGGTVMFLAALAVARRK